MAKVKFNANIDYMTGRVGSTVMMPSDSKLFSISRNYVYPTLTADNHNKGAIMQNLKAMWADADSLYKADLKKYVTRYRALGLVLPNLKQKANNAFAYFVRLMWAQADLDPTHIDLLTVTCADINALDAAAKVIETAIEAGLLPMIPVYNDLTNSIV